MALSKFTAYLHDEFPLVRHMQVSVAGWDHQTITLKAPLEPNINHADTAFGGSISTLGILAGYMLLHLALDERKISHRILIQKSTTDFRRPIEGPMTVVASLPAEGSADDLEAFLATLEKKRRARMTVNSQVHSGPMVAATHSGLYVAILY